MKKTFIIIALAVGSVGFTQTTSEIPAPDSLKTEQVLPLYSSRIFIPIETEQKLLKKMIDDATPRSQRIHDNSKTEELNFSCDIRDGDTRFSGNTVNHRLRLTNGDGSYRRRGWTKCPWPFHGRCYGPWTRVDCNEIRGNIDLSVSLLILPDYRIQATGKAKVEIDNARCAGFNVTSILRAGGWHRFEQNLNKNLEKAIRNLDLKGPVNDIWQKMQLPQKLDQDLFLMVKPARLLYSNLVFREGFARTAIGLEFSALIDDSAHASTWVSAEPLPQLSKEDMPETDNVQLNVPVNLSYAFLQKTASEKLSGQIIRRKTSRGKEKKVAKINDVTVFGSQQDSFELVVGLDVKVYRGLFRRENARIFLHTRLSYDSTSRMLTISDYKLDSQTESGLYNRSLEGIANKLAYRPILKRLSFDAGKVIDKQLGIVNEKLAQQIELAPGIILNGSVQKVEFKHVIAQPDRISLLFSCDATAKITVQSL